MTFVIFCADWPLCFRKLLAGGNIFAVEQGPERGGFIFFMLGAVLAIYLIHARTNAKNAIH